MNEGHVTVPDRGNWDDKSRTSPKRFNPYLPGKIRDKAGVLQYALVTSSFHLTGEDTA